MPQIHYDWDDEIGRKIGLEGASIIGLMTGEHLHPPMINRRQIWSRGENWKSGAKKCVMRLAKRAKIKPGSKVLDVGCGVGGSSILLASEYKCNVIGIDLSKKQIKTAKRITTLGGLEDKIDFVLANAEALPFPSGAFDYVWTFNMFYHILDKERAIVEFKRVLNERGLLAFDDWVITERIDRDEHALLKYDWSSTDWVTDVNLFDMLRDNGFNLKKIDDYSNVGKGLMKRYFVDIFENYFRPKIISLDKEWGESMANHFRNAVERTIHFYESGKIRYLQLVANKK